MTPKELFSQPNPNKIVDGRCRTRPIRCPICREVFYGYEKIEQFENRTSDEPFLQSMNQPDRLGYVPCRLTCGAYECYIAEERYCHSKSPFFHQEQHPPTEQIKRPKGIASLQGLL
jgi:hypothetical protein